MVALPGEFAGDICGWGKPCGPGICLLTARKAAAAPSILNCCVKAMSGRGVKFFRRGVRLNTHIASEEGVKTIDADGKRQIEGQSWSKHIAFEQENEL